MKTLNAVVLSALLTGCSSTHFDYDLSPGVEVRLNGYVGADRAEMQRDYTEVVTQFSSVFPDVNVPALFNSGPAYLNFEPDLSNCADIGATCPTKVVGWTNGVTVVVHYTVFNASGHPSEHPASDPRYETDASAKLDSLSYKHELAHVLLLRSKKVVAESQDDYISSKFGY